MLTLRVAEMSAATSAAGVNFMECAFLWRVLFRRFGIENLFYGEIEDAAQFECER